MLGQFTENFNNIFPTAPWFLLQIIGGKVEGVQFTLMLEGSAVVQVKVVIAQALHICIRFGDFI
jgi:hypothetical protein